MNFEILKNMNRIVPRGCRVLGYFYSSKDQFFLNYDCGNPPSDSHGSTTKNWYKFLSDRVKCTAEVNHWVCFVMWTDSSEDLLQFHRLAGNLSHAPRIPLQVDQLVLRTKGTLEHDFFIFKALFVRTQTAQVFERPRNEISDWLVEISPITASRTRRLRLNDSQSTIARLRDFPGFFSDPTE